MKKITLSIFGLWLLTGCNNRISNQPPVIQNTKTEIVGNYLGSDYKGNYVWGGAMNLAWNELNETILHEKLQLNTDDETALEMVEKLNEALFSKKDLDEASYYVKAGYGQKTVEAINKESKKKFPSKSFGDLKMDLEFTDIISYAYFLKEVEYEVSFEKERVFFNKEFVTGFSANNQKQKENIEIIKYENDDKFIIKLKLKDQLDELILAKGYDMENPQKVMKEIKKNNNKKLSKLKKTDHFRAPKLHLDHNRKYIELIGKFLKNKGFEDYFIAQMFENIKFDMDEKGVRVENEAVILMAKSIPMERSKPKNFILDKSYWIVMKRTDSQNPYFILGINNTELMEKK